MDATPTVLAGIVAFHPDPAQLRRLVAAVAPGLGALAVVANSPLAPEEEASLRREAGGTPLLVLRPAGNEGVGAAYNRLLAEAEARACAFVFLLDQDSLPAPGAVAALAARWRRLAEAGERPAIVAAQPVAPGGRPLGTAAAPDPRFPDTPLRRAGFAFSSGSLVACAAARAVGPFRADFFIDAIDVEWGMRARAGGFSVWVASDVPMQHALGRGVIRLPLGLTLTDQPPLRLYTFLRNQLAMLRLPHVPRAHKARTLLLLPARIGIYLAHHRLAPEVRRAVARGLLDGLRHRLGSPERVFPPRAP
ncbi:rhamnosyltransferase [Methylobacterium sp. 4-46]|uniref:rhamnosyltransferase n=1 Tax=unclassified Methylobacterium TaxID=2615210 RepID=UPI000165CAE0|nr:MULTISPECIES: rhamnosyltransferase [Methylobacterium]ACA19543.1 rhamnosyltransferase [Methylobacterium sp. 4-46]WFT78738.1 rhamnosyl transferase [Methylobacterium nodulans]